MMNKLFGAATLLSSRLRNTAIVCAARIFPRRDLFANLLQTVEMLSLNLEKFNTQMIEIEDRISDLETALSDFSALSNLCIATFDDMEDSFTITCNEIHEFMEQFGAEKDYYESKDENLKDASSCNDSEYNLDDLPF